MSSTPVKTDPSPSAPAEASNRVTLGWSNRLLARPEIGALVAAIVIFIFFLIVAPAFRSPASFFTVLYQSSTIGIVAVAVGMLMIGGEFDLSAGVLVTTAGLFNAMFCYQLGINLWVGAILSLVLCLGIGFLNGYLVMRTGIPSFLITLGTFFVLQGANLGVTKLVTGSVSSPNINQMAGYDSLNWIFAHEWQIGSVTLSITVVWWFLFVALSAFILQRTKTGNWIFAVGGNADSARAVGVPVTRVKIGLFMTVAFLAWFAGMHYLYNYNTLQAGNGVGNEFLYIIAAVVGGTMLTGGYGNAIGVAIGAFIFGMTSLCIVYAGWDPNWFKPSSASCSCSPSWSTSTSRSSRPPERWADMTDTLHDHADPGLHKGEPLVEMINIGKTYGAIRALKGINLTVNAGEVTCVLGDNGAGKSTLIKIISGLHPHNEGTMKVDGKEVSFSSPRDSLGHGIATVYQDLAVVSLMEVWRNFFLGSEMVSRRGPLAPMRINDMKRIADEELRKMASSSRTSTSPSARSPAASASASRSPAPSTSAPACSSSTSRPRPSASSSPVSC